MLWKALAILFLQLSHAFSGSRTRAPRAGESMWKEGKSHDKSAGCGGTQIVIVPICYQCMPALPALLVQLQATHHAPSLCFVTYKMGRGAVPGGNGYTCLVALRNGRGADNFSSYGDWRCYQLQVLLVGGRATGKYVMPAVAPHGP